MVGGGEIGDGTLYGPLACRGGDSYSQAQAEGGHGSSLTPPLSQNSRWEFPVTSRSHPSLDPGHPLCIGPKKNFLSIYLPLLDSIEMNTVFYHLSRFFYPPISSKMLPNDPTAHP